MIRIATVDLRHRKIRFPNNRVGMVLAQPYLPNTYFTGTEPYRFTAQAKPRQISAIARTLEVALQRHMVFRGPTSQCFLSTAFRALTVSLRSSASSVLMDGQLEAL